MNRTIFYAWQSDLPGETNRFFIKDALNLAIERINANLQAVDAIRADQDTQGVAGSPTVADVIFSKIDDCTAFIADVTTVTGKGESRPAPNPNVMIEYGRASKLGDSFLIQVFNGAFGDPIDHRPFDLRHKRKPITYRLTKNDSLEKRENEKAKLSERIEEALRAILESKPTKTVLLPAAAEFDQFRSMYAAIQRPEWQNRHRRIIGFWCAAIPIGKPIDLGRVSAQPHLVESRRPLKMKLSPQQTMTCETMDFSTGNKPVIGPVAGGLSAKVDHSYVNRAGDFVKAALSDHTVLKNGAVFIGMRSCDIADGPHLNIRCIIADVANILRTVELVRAAANAGTQAYALAVELRYDDQFREELTPVSAGNWRLCYPDDENGSRGPIVSSKPILIGPKMIKPFQHFPVLVSDVFSDLYEAAGRSAPSSIDFEA